MKLPRIVVSFCFFVSIPTAYSQHRVDLRNMHERILAVVPFVGTGTAQDPRRPLYAPIPTPGAAPSHDGIIAFSFLESDDGRYAIVELVARDRAAFKQIFTDNRADVKFFEKGKAAKADIEAEFRKYRKNFSVEQLEVGAL